MRSYKKLWTSFLCSAAMLTLPSSFVSAMEIEQAQALMPEISVYVHDTDQNLSSLNLSDIAATLDGKPLSVDRIELSEEGIYYIFMFDISRSLSEEYVAAAKEALMAQVFALRPQDKLAVLSFGTEVHTLLTGGEDETAVNQALDTIHSTDSYTHFYDAVDALLKVAQASPDMRYIAVVVSDGIDTQAIMTQDEIEAILRQSGIPIYALSADSATEEDQQNFANFIEVSGGEAFLFHPDNAAESLQSLLDRVDQVYKLTLTADDSFADGNIHSLSIGTADGESVSVDIQIDKTAEEYARPEVSGYELDFEQEQIIVSFTKEMADLTDPSCYSLLSDQQNNASIEIVTSDASSVTLHADIFQADSWVLSIAGLTDASEQHNPLTAISVPLEELPRELETEIAAETETETAMDPQAEDKSEASEAETVTAPPAEEKSIASYLPFAAIPLVLILLLVLLLVKKNKSGRKGRKGPDKQDVQFFFEDK